MEGPAVSTIVPAFNAERFLGEAIESVLAQDYRPHEVVVVDDGSTDGTAEVAAAFPEVQLIRQANLGPAAARNAAIEAASGELIALLDADDLMEPDRLETQVTYLLEHPEAAAVLGRQELLIESGVDPPRWATELPAMIESVGGKGMSERIPVLPDHPTPSMLARRSAFEQVGPYDTSFRLGEDVDWVIRAWECGLELAAVDDVVIRRRVHGANLTYDEAGCMRALLRMLKTRIERGRRGGTGSAALPE
jgi:glycosyltransferase involved in cell wall biosynthesis